MHSSSSLCTRLSTSCRRVKTIGNEIMHVVTARVAMAMLRIAIERLSESSACSRSFSSITEVSLLTASLYSVALPENEFRRTSFTVSTSEIKTFFQATA